MNAARRFGVSTELVHREQLSRAHLRDIAAAGFEQIELKATPSHFNYRNPANVADLQQWLAEAGTALRAVHGPLGEAWTGGRTVGPFSLAASDPVERDKAVAETLSALQIARRIAFGVMVVHLGPPRWAAAGQAEITRDAARRSIETIAEAAEPLGVRIALEVFPNELSRAGSLVHFIESSIEASNVGICLDIGHAQLEGDIFDIIDTVSEHLFAVDLNDNRGRADDHLMPFDGTIDWAGAMTAIQKVGYEGPLMIEVSARGSLKDSLGAARKARTRLERLLAD